MKQKNSRLQITVSPEELAIFTKKSKERGLSIGNFLREKLGMSLILNVGNFKVNNPRKKS